jgi:hypothetical protein
VSNENTNPSDADNGADPQAPEGDARVDKPSTGQDAPDPKEEALVKKRWRCYEDARKFDQNFRKQIAIDRRYAAGTSDTSWAVDTNLIGAYIDILVSLLYARDPDVSVRKAPQANDESGKQFEQFARTTELIISHLWRKGNLKRAARKQVRSVLSNAEGWLKCTIIAEKTPMPETDVALNDARETLERLQGAKKELADDQGGDPDLVDAEKAKVEALIDELEEKIEVAIRKFFAIDFIKTERMQVSPDVEFVADYLDADWCGNEIYISKADAISRFPRLTDEDMREAKLYYQNAPKELTTRDVDNILPQGQLTAADAEGMTSNSSDPEAYPFVRSVEIWDRTEKRIYTLLEGVKKWAKEPFAPPYPTSRFYPYFGLFFYEVDGQRHPQSLSWRLYKLQDEYSCTRSNFRLSRERAIPATIFDSTSMEESEVRKIQEAKQQEFIGVRPSDPSKPIGNNFTPKPVSAIDPRLYDTTPIIQDMERMSGVQEALQASISAGMPKTATEASIQQSGTNARTTSDRDQLEWMLTDMAQYATEQALEALQIRDAQRICGPAAYWPHGMDIDDLFTLCEITIDAGSTGKPRQQMDQQAWGVILPQIQQTIKDIEQALAMGNKPLASALTELVKETMLRFGDDTDVERFIPQVPPPGSPGAGAPPHSPPAKVTVQLKGNISPEAAQTLIAPELQLNGNAAPNTPTPPPGTVPSTGAAPAPGPGLTQQPEKLPPHGAPK